MSASSKSPACGLEPQLCGLCQPVSAHPGDAALLRSADRPEHGVVHKRLEPRIPPHLLLMAKGGVEHASIAVGAGPGQRPAIRMPVDEVAGEIDRRRVEAQQYMRAAGIEIADLIDLVRERDRRA